MKMRLRNKPWAMDLIEDHPEIVEKSPTEWRGNWKNKFGNENPIHVEVGTGKGQFVTRMASAYPNVNFIGKKVFLLLVFNESLMNLSLIFVFCKKT